MRATRVLMPMALVVAFVGVGCGGDDEGTQTATSSPATSIAVASTTSAPTTTEIAVSTTAPVTTTAAPLPAWVPDHLRWGDDGLVLVSQGSGQVLVEEPVAWAASDGAGGVLFHQGFTDSAPIQWLAAGHTDPVEVHPSSNPVLVASFDGRPAIVHSWPAPGCEPDGSVAMVIRDLTTGVDTSLDCSVGGQDSGRDPSSYGGAMYVGVWWTAQGFAGTSHALEFRDDHGVVIDLPANPFADDCAPCSLRPRLSPDGRRLAVIYRATAPWPPESFASPEALDAWAASTASIPATLLVFDVATGAEQLRLEVPVGRTFDGFDGRVVLLGPGDATSESILIDTVTGEQIDVEGRIALVVRFS